MVHTGEILAQVRGWANHEAAEKTTVNALRLFQKMR
jgi:Tat protein secretion system quality control protein TatD with DNase activity